MYRYDGLVDRLRGEISQIGRTKKARLPYLNNEHNNLASTDKLV